MENKPCPEFLYRYRAYNTEEHKAWVREIILENKFYAANPNSFNDPFDCKILPSMRATEKEEMKYHGRALKSVFPKLSPPKRLIEARKFTNRKSLSKLPPDFNQSAIDSFGIISFSGIKDSILLWSHYADSHKGVCFQYKSFTTLKPIAPCMPVIYSNDYPEILLVDIGANKVDIEPIFLTKSSHWEYENEYRSINYIEHDRYFTYSADYLAGIIFGCEMEEPDKQEIRDMVAQRKHKPVFYQARKAERQFGLVIEPVAS